MTDQDFIDAILAEPDDDAPRLIYADWLEERGDPRAEFIRAQVEVATLAQPVERKTMYGYGNAVPECRNRKNTVHFRMLWARQLELLTAHCAKWVEPLIGKATGVIFERGCVEGISAQPEVFAKNAAIWYQSMPIRQLCVVTPKKLSGWYSLLGSPHLLKIHTLELAWNFTPSPVAALAECPHAANLKKLYLPGGLDDELFHKLQQSPYLKNAVLRGAF